MFDNLEEIITDLRIKYNNIDVCIIGDLNARTGNASDVLEMGQDEVELIDEYVSLDNMNIPENRISFDNIVNNYGTRLLTLCKSLYMFIVNGRKGNEAQVGRPTCKNVSVVDYFIQYEQTSLEGDVSGIMRELDRLSSDTSQTMQTEVNNVVSDINDMFNDAARSLGMFRSGHTPSGCSRSRVRSKPHKNWYNQECENKRKIFLKHKNKYRRLRNNNNLQQLRQTGKDYKNEINKAVRKYKQQVIHTIRNLKSENPRDYWNIINKKITKKQLLKLLLRYLGNTLKT